MVPFYLAGILLVFLGALIFALSRWLIRPSVHRSVEPTDLWNYEKLQEIFRKESLPAVVVSFDIFDSNAELFVGQIAGHGKKMRLATKSIRVPGLIHRVTGAHSNKISGLMCFSADEAAFFAGQGYDDILLAYPLAQSHDFEHCWQACSDSKQLRLVLMIDSVSHVVQAANYWLSQAFAALKARETVPCLRFCIDADMSYRPVGRVHLGAHRSSCRTLSDVDKLLDAVVAANRAWTRIWRDGVAVHEGSFEKELEIVGRLPWNDKVACLSAPLVSIVGLMGYEAQVAGVTDANGCNPWLNLAVAVFKPLSMRDVYNRRRQLVEHLSKRGVQLAFVNGGGTGSVAYTCKDAAVTEVTVGSGLLQGKLFDLYISNQAQPAFLFGLRVTRACQSDVVCCQSGGFIASGEISPDKAPEPFLPKGLRTFPTEGFGEVQTPLLVEKTADSLTKQLGVGDVVFFRPAKSGELAERFSHYLCMAADEPGVLKRMETYRGKGMVCF